MPTLHERHTESRAAAEACGMRCLGKRLLIGSLILNIRKQANHLSIAYSRRNDR